MTQNPQSSPNTVDQSPRPVPAESCLLKVVALLLLAVSIATGAWNIIVRAPFDEPVGRPAIAADSVPMHALVHPFSANTFLAHEVEFWRKQKTIEMISLAEIGWIKQQFLWSQIEPSPGSHWDAEYQQDAWKKYDEIVDLAESYGIRVIARLDHTPPWSRDEGTDYHSPPADVDDYGRFVGKFVERYSGRVQYIQIWNEPNLSREWGGETDPVGYFELLKSAYQHAKEADPDVVVLSAPMAMTNEYSERAMPELEYWQQLFDLGAHEYFDVLTATGFGINDPPERAPEGNSINLRRIEQLRVLMDQYALDDTAIWLTEYGWNAPPATVPDEELQWGRVTPEEQAVWTARGIEWMTENWDWFGVSSIWYFRQTGVIPPAAPEYYFAMVDLEFTPRPVYLSVNDVAASSRIGLPGIYGPLESPVKAFGVWSRYDDPGATFGHAIAGRDEGDRIDLLFSGTDVSLRLSPSVESYGRIYVKLDGAPMASGPFEVDENGNHFLDIGASTNASGVLPLVSESGTDRPQQVRTLSIILDDETQLAIAAVEIDYQRSYSQFLLTFALSLAGVVVAGALLRR